MRLADDEAEGRLVGEAERQGGRGLMKGESADRRSWSVEDRSPGQQSERQAAGYLPGLPGAGWTRVAGGQSMVEDSG